MTSTTFPANWSAQHFTPEIELSFQASYYLRARSTLRLASGLLAVTLAIYALLGIHEKMGFVGKFNIPQLILCLVVFGLTWVDSFGRIWQPFLVVAGWLAAALMFDTLAVQMQASPPPVTDKMAGDIMLRLIFTLQVCVFMITLATFRLTFKPMLSLQVGVVLLGLFAQMRHFPMSNWLNIAQFFEPVFVVLSVILITSFTQEKVARGAFEFNRRLAELQLQEHAQRLETEKMLHILNGAIGGVVHDIGNPLTTVQTGAELTKDLLSDEQPDVTMLGELNGIVLRGAQMLAFLRISLIEQSRVLEGKPVPVDVKPVSVRSIVEAGASFQKQRFAQKHPLHIEGEDLHICVDEMKMVTVLMNLIGNALKYSDGEVAIMWLPREHMLQLAVMDTGTKGCGLSRPQAERLFAAFGRLEEHNNIEGTGLGLMSVRKIVEAHGGEIWIEGFTDGTPKSPQFSTNPHTASPLLQSPFHTAFVLTCPLSAQ